jgi:hypothetical protein
MSAMPSPIVTQDDLIATAAWFRQLMPPQMRDWVTTGAPSEALASRAVDEMTRRVNLHVSALAQSVGKSDAARFEAELGLAVKRLHIAAVALARGGAQHIRIGDVADDAE